MKGDGSILKRILVFDVKRFFGFIENTTIFVEEKVTIDDPFPCAIQSNSGVVNQECENRERRVRETHALRVQSNRGDETLDWIWFESQQDNADDEAEVGMTFKENLRAVPV